MKKDNEDREVMFVKSDKKLNSKTLIELINIVLNSKWWEKKKKKKEKL